METTPKQYLKIYLPLACLVLLYLITRLAALTDLPISSHEATWIHWAQINVQYPNELLIAVSIGEQPLFMWLNAVTLRTTGLALLRRPGEHPKSDIFFTSLFRVTRLI